MSDALRIASIMLTDPSTLASFVAASVLLAPLLTWYAGHVGWSRWRLLASALAGVGVAATLALTWGRWLVIPDLHWRGCLAGSSLGTTDGEAILNWLVLMPGAFFATLAWQRVWPVVGLCLGVPVLVELVQSFAGLGTCQTVDVIRNGGGALVAAAVAALLLQGARVTRAE